MNHPSIQFTIPITPSAQMRARSTARGGFARTYKHPEQRRHEEQLMPLLVQHRPLEPFTGPLSLTVMAFLPIPGSKPKWWHDAAQNGALLPVTKPDLDNLVKNIKDCMQTVGFYANDSQVVEVVAQKLYSTCPRWAIKLLELPQVDAKEWKLRGSQEVATKPSNSGEDRRS